MLKFHATALRAVGLVQRHRGATAQHGSFGTGQRSGRNRKGRSRNAHRVVIAEVNVGEPDAAICRVRQAVVMGKRAGRRGRTSDDARGVIGAGDGDGDVLRHRRAAMTVVDGDRVDLRDGLTHRQRLQHRVAVVERERPAQRAGVIRVGVVLGHRGSIANVPISPPQDRPRQSPGGSPSRPTT